MLRTLILLLSLGCTPAVSLSVPQELIRNAIPLTVTMLALTPGHCNADGGDRTGEVEVQSVGRSLALRGAACLDPAGGVSADTPPFGRNLIEPPLADATYFVRVTVYPYGDDGRAYLYQGDTVIDEWVVRRVRR